MASVKSNKPMGAPPEYPKWLTEEGLQQIRMWAANGIYLKDIASNMGIAYGTLADWRNRFPEIDEAIKDGRRDADALVEDALYKKAFEGYQLSEKKYIAVEMSTKEYQEKLALEMEKYDEENPDADPRDRRLFELSIPNTRMVLVEDKLKQTAPDTAAQVFYLKNRKEAEWRDRRYYEGTNDVKVHDPLEGLTTEELKALALQQLTKGNG
ncbi:transposase [Lysinibacillus phage vB_LspM-01]|nr:transposase [Lysinibacillus phage vB_LspM-01]